MALGWGVVGTGKLAEAFVGPTIARQPDSRIVAAFDVDHGRALAFAGAYKGAEAYEDYDRLLADPSVDIVYIASPNAFHARQAIAAVRAGKHVFCEKPMALALPDGREMVNAAARAGRLLGVGFHLRHKPSNLAARQLVADGKLGRVYFAEFERGSSKQAFPHDTWRAMPELSGGGSVINQGSHVIDLLRFITGLNITSICARVDRTPIDDVMAAVCTLENGALANISSHQLRYNTRPDYVVMGDDGWLQGLGAGSTIVNDSVELITDAGKSVVQGSDRTPYQCEVDDFAKAVLGRAPLNGNGEDGLHVIAVQDALYRSVRENRVVAVEPIW